MGTDRGVPPLRIGSDNRSFGDPLVAAHWSEGDRHSPEAVGAGNPAEVRGNTGATV
jgi:hypothetical protein